MKTQSEVLLNKAILALSFNPCDDSAEVPTLIAWSNDL